MNSSEERYEAGYGQGGRRQPIRRLQPTTCAGDNGKVRMDSTGDKTNKSVLSVVVPLRRRLCYCRGQGYVEK